MNTSLWTVKKLGLSAFIVLSFVVMLTFGVPALVGNATEDQIDNCPPPVEVPVFLDEVLYQPDEFNIIHCELNSKGIYLLSLINPSDGMFQSFTSQDGLEEFCSKNGLPSVSKMLDTAKNSLEATQVGTTPTPSINEDYPPPIKVPIVFDGAFYQPEEYNRIQKELYSRYPSAVFCIDPNDGTFYGFSSYDGFATYAKEHGLPIIEFPEAVEMNVGMAP